VFSWLATKPTIIWRLENFLTNPGIGRWISEDAKQRKMDSLYTNKYRQKQTKNKQKQIKIQSLIAELRTADLQ